MNKKTKKKKRWLFLKERERERFSQILSLVRTTTNRRNGTSVCVVSRIPGPYTPFPLPSLSPVTRGETSSQAHAYTRISAAAVFASTITTPPPR